MTEKLLECAVHSLDKHLARDITAIDVEPISPIADRFVFATGGSTTQVKALCDYVEEDMAKAGFPRCASRAMPPPTGSSWTTAHWSSTSSQGCAPFL